MTLANLLFSTLILLALIVLGSLCFIAGAQIESLSNERKKNIEINNNLASAKRGDWYYDHTGRLRRDEPVRPPVVNYIEDQHDVH